MSPETLVLLSLAVPAAGGVLIGLTGSRPNLREGVTLATAGILLASVLGLLGHVLQGGRPRVTLVETLPGLPLELAVEPLGMLFAGVAAFLWPVNSLYSIGYMRGNREGHQTRFYVCFAVAMGSAMGVAFSGNLITLFAFYEVLTLSTYPLVTHKGTEEAVRAGRTYLGILIGTSVGLLLPAIIWTSQAAGTVEFRAGGILEGKMTGAGTGLLLLLYVFGLGKAAIMPVHRWLPAAMVAPTPVSALLHAVAVVKAGVFAVVKVVTYVFGVEYLAGLSGAGWLPFVAGFTIIAASVVALRSDNLKRRLAYSTVSQLSYVVLGVAILSPYSVAGAALHIVAHAFAKITLFFAAGSIYTAAHKTEVSELDGIGRRMPVTMAAFAVGSLSLIGIPPFVGFLGKWYILLGAVRTHQWPWVAVLATGTLLSAGYLLPIVYAAFFRTEPQHETRHGGNGEAPAPIVIALSLSAATTVLLFFFPDAVLALAHALGGLAPVR